MYTARFALAAALAGSLLVACSGSDHDGNDPDLGSADGGTTDTVATPDLPPIPSGAFAVGGGGSDKQSNATGWDVAVDAMGNCHVSGGFTGTLPLGGKTLTTTSGGAFVAKLDPKGKLLWLTGATGGIDTYGMRSVDVDAEGNVYVVGAFMGSATFGKTTLSVSTQSLFVAKLDSKGAYAWVKKLETAATTPPASGGDVLPRRLAVDSGGNLLITGALSGKLDLGASSLAVATGRHTFVIKLDATGQPLWASASSGKSNVVSQDLALAGEAVLVSGSFLGTDVTFGSKTYKPTGQMENLFAARLDSKGKWLWATLAGAAASSGSFGTVAYGVAADASGNAYITGRYAGTVAFGGTSLTAKGNLSAFVAKLDDKGSFVWATSAGGDTVTDTGFLQTIGRDLQLDPAGKIHVAGAFSDKAAFGSTTLSAKTTDAFVATLDSSGSFVRALQGGGTGSEEGKAVAVDRAGNAYVTGYYSGGDATFGATTLKTFSTSGSALYVWKIPTK